MRPTSRRSSTRRGAGLLHPGAGARARQAVPDAGRGCLLDHRPRHGGHRRVEQGIVNTGDTLRSSACTTPPRRRHRRRDVPQDPRPGPGRRQRRLPAPRHQARGDRARSSLQAGSITPHTKYKAEVYVLRRRRRAPHPVLHRHRRSSTSRHRRDRRGEAARRCRRCHCRATRPDGDRADASRSR